MSFKSEYQIKCKDCGIIRKFNSIMSIADADVKCPKCSSLNADIDKQTMNDVVLFDKLMRKDHNGQWRINPDAIHWHDYDEAENKAEIKSEEEFKTDEE